MIVEQIRLRRPPVLDLVKYRGFLFKDTQVVEELSEISVSPAATETDVLLYAVSKADANRIYMEAFDIDTAGHSLVIIGGGEEILIPLQAASDVWGVYDIGLPAAKNYTMYYIVGGAALVGLLLAVRRK